MNEESNQDLTKRERLSEETEDSRSEEERFLLEKQPHQRENMKSFGAPHYAGFWMRFWAYLLDLIVISSISRLIVYPVFRAFEWDLNAGGMFSAINIATAAVFYLYFIITTKVWGQTVGKMVFGLKVVSLTDGKLSWQTVFIRELVGRYLSATIFILYVLVAFLPKKQGLHDYFADTAVLHEQTVSVAEPAYS